MAHRIRPMGGHYCTLWTCNLMLWRVVFYKDAKEPKRIGKITRWLWRVVTRE